MLGAFRDGNPSAQQVVGLLLHLAPGFLSDVFWQGCTGGATRQSIHGSRFSTDHRRPQTAPCSTPRSRIGRLRARTSHKQRQTPQDNRCSTGYAQGSLSSKTTTSNAQATEVLQSTTTGEPSPPRTRRQPTSSSPVTDRLVGVDDDPLIPTSAAIDRVLRDGRATWTAFLNRADSLPPHVFPAGFGDPSIVLKDVPALPAHLPKHRSVVGRALWHVPDPEHEPENNAGNGEFSFQYLHGRRKYFQLSVPEPVECHVCYSDPALSSHGLSNAQSGLSILTMCWSYILSARLLELQGTKAVYSQHYLLPVTAKAFKAVAGEIPLELGSASQRLVRWLYAILSPRPGWSTTGSPGFPTLGRLLFF